MPGAVQFVAGGKVREPGGAPRSYLDERVQVAIRLLRLSDQRGDLRLIRGQSLRRLQRLLPGNPLEPFIDVRVDEHRALVLPFAPAGRATQVSECPAVP